MSEAVREASWFDGAGLGMFVHWDHASQEGLEVSWPLVGGAMGVLPRCQDVTPEHYHALADTFDPVAFDAADLARRARSAGMRYVVFTTRHHSGYAMWPSAHGHHGVAGSPCRRDLVREVVEAFRAEGLRIGLYYSLSDWHHPDYPPFRLEHRPYQFGFSPPRPDEEAATRFRAYLLAQLDELLTGYGPIDVVWFDGQWERPPAWFGTDEIAARCRQLQPGILINDRLPGHGDFATPEQFVPATPPVGRWESCYTMNDSWGWNPDDHAYKSARDLVHALCETVGRGGNLLLNVSPRGDGSLPDEQVERLDALAAWMARHAVAIHDVAAGLEPWQFYGPSTRAGDRIHLLCLMRPYETVTVRGLPVRRVVRATALGTGTELEVRTRTDVFGHFMDDPDGEVIVSVPEADVDELATVITLELADHPVRDRPG